MFGTMIHLNGARNAQAALQPTQRKQVEYGTAKLLSIIAIISGRVAANILGTHLLLSKFIISRFKDNAKDNAQHY